MPYILIIWLAMGATRVEHQPNEAACFTRLQELRNYFEKTYVIRSSGCFPRQLIIEASKLAAP